MLKPAALPAFALYRRAEQLIHKSVVEHLRWRGVPWLFVFHPANGGARSPTEAAIFKSLGVVAGVPDLIIINGGHEAVAYLEAWGLLRGVHT